MDAYSPSPNASKHARNAMAVAIAQGEEPQAVVSEMINVIVVADAVPVSDPMVHAMASWAIAQIGDFVSDIQERMGYMVEAAAVMNGD